jgi:hypothetical protein
MILSTREAGVGSVAGHNQCGSVLAIQIWQKSFDTRQPAQDLKVTVELGSPTEKANRFRPQSAWRLLVSENQDIQDQGRDNEDLISFSVSNSEISQR